MDCDEFRKQGKIMVDFIADYMEHVKNRRVIPDVEPGYLRDLLPEKAPETCENFADILDDVERTIMPGVSGSSLCNYIFTKGPSI